jgi:GMP synthase-like glutamine amidotransferase
VFSERSDADYVLQLADVNIDIIHYPEANTARVLEHNPVCVLISGQTAPWTDYESQVLVPVFDFLTTTDLPVLGICGGHQLIAQAYGVLVAPMGYQELGYITVDLSADDPLLQGIDSPATFFSWHGEEVKAMPEEYINLGSSDLCAVQIFRHHNKEIFGVQFHPELSGRKPDGRVLLLNFFELAGVPLRK